MEQRPCTVEEYLLLCKKRGAGCGRWYVLGLRAQLPLREIEKAAFELARDIQTLRQLILDHGNTPIEYFDSVRGLVEFRFGVSLDEDLVYDRLTNESWLRTS